MGMRHLLAPASIAVVGASDRPGPGAEVSRNVLRSADAGVRVYLINPNRAELFGERCYPDLAALPEVPDCIIFATSPHVVLPVLAQAAELGVGGATILASGFAEIENPQGAALQSDVLRIASQSGMAVCGPNCLGAADFARGIHGTSMAFAEIDSGIHPPSVAVISQSGGLLIGLTLRAAARRLPLHSIISSGNEAVTGVEDYLDYLLADPAIRVIAMLCEGFRDVRHLADAGRRAAAAGKRLAILKLGRSVRGRLAVRAHTGRDAGSDAEITKAFVESGIAQFDRTDELVEFCYLASRFPHPPGNRVAAMMVSGGAAALVCDAAERWGLKLAEWSDTTIQGLRDILPSYARAANPLDLTGGTMLHNREAVERAVRLIGDDPGTDILNFVFPLHPDGGSEGMRKVVGVIAEVALTLTKPIAVISTNAGTVTGYWADFATRSSCAFLEDVETAFAAMAGWANAVAAPSPRPQGRPTKA